LIPRLLLLLGLLAAPPAAAQPASIVALDGEWRFRAGDSLHWAAPGHDDSGWDTVEVPAAWESFLGAYDGFGWYRLTVSLPADAAAAPVGIRFGTVGDSFELYWNGVWVGGSGRLPPRYVEGVEPIRFLVPDSVLRRAGDGDHVVAVRVYNHYAYGGLMTPVRIAPYQVLAADASPRNTVIAVLVAFFLAIGIYHLAFFLRRPGSVENLYFAVLCACVSIYGATFSDAVARLLMPVVNPYRLGLMAFLAAGPFYVALINTLFDLPRGRRTTALYAGFAAAVGVAAVLPLALLAEFNRWIDHALVLGLLAVVVRAGMAASPATTHPRVLLAGTAAFSVAFVYDLLSEYGYVPVAFVLPDLGSLFWIGFLVFVLAVGIATAGRWARTEVAALTDPLTGLARRHVLEEALRRETERLRRGGEPLALVLIDLDHFKRVNDTHGHPVGDEVLARVGRLIRAGTRNLDIAARYGGEEFAVLLFDTGMEGALSFAARFREGLRALEVPVVPGGSVQVTASLGIAVGSELATPEGLIAAADRALYRAKGEGRDRLVTSAVDGDRCALETTVRG
jgi:diguanylate cyclase (GGDEF)-like protein